MNIFAQIKPVVRYNKVSYYSVVINHAGKSLFEDFVIRHTKSNRKKLNHILSWIKIIGNKYGAQAQFFRPEAEISDTSALPPKGVKREPAYIEHGKKRSNNLRLYCFRANERVVFLFNGDIKTKLEAQDCPNVGPHFNLANELTFRLDEALKSGDIRWNGRYDDIVFDDEFTIETNL